MVGLPRRQLNRRPNGCAIKSITVKEFLDQKEEITEEIVPFEYSDLAKELFEMVYLEFYYWVVEYEEGVEWFVRVVEENSYVKKI